MHHTGSTTVFTSDKKSSPKYGMNKEKRKNFCDELTKTLMPNISPVKHSPSIKSFAML